MAARDWKIGDKLICMSDRYGRVCPRGFESVITGQCLGDGGGQIGWYSTDAIGSPSAMTYEAYDENFVPKADAPVSPEVAQLQARVAELEGALAADNDRTDFSLKAGDIVEKDNWTLTKLIVVDVNWALRAAALRLGEEGNIVVWPVAGMRRA